MADAKMANERLRLAILLTILAVVVVVAMIRFLGEGGIGGGVSRTATLEYEARNLEPLETDSFVSHDRQTIPSGGNPFAFRARPTPTARPRPTAMPRPTLPPRPTPTPRLAVGEDGEIKAPPPPFDREYIGFFGPEQFHVAAFRKPGDSPGSSEIDVAIVGTVLDGLFIVREIGLESVVIGYVGYAPSEDTRVPLSEN